MCGELMTHEHDLILPSLSSLAKMPARRGHELVDLSALGIHFPLEGFDKGFATQGDVLTQTVDGRDLNEIWNEFQAMLAFQNERRQPLVDLLTFPVTQPIEEVPQIAGEDFEEASEFGIPKKIRGGAYFQLGYDFKWYDVGVGYTWMYLAEATAAQVESQANMVAEADNRLIFNKVMRAVFNNVNRVATIRNQAINVYPFYNADGTIPPAYKNYAFDGTHTHYLTSGAVVVDSGDLDDMETHLVHHGYGKQGGAQLILLVNRTELAVIRTFRVSTGSAYDFIPASNQPPFLLPVNTGGIGNAQPPSQVAGFAVAGSYGPWLIVEEDYVPSGYLFGFATGGQMQATNPVGFRQHQNASLRGLRLVKGREADYPLIDSYWNRGFGTGVRHRGAAVLMQLKVAAGYVIPTAYV